MNAALRSGLALLVLLLPWHEFVVHAWKPLGVWKELVMAALLVAVAVRGRAGWLPTRLAAPMAAVLGVVTVSLLANGLSLHPVRYLFYMAAGLAAAQLPEREDVAKVCRALVWMGVAAALYGLLSWAAFRALGGGPGMRPEVESPWLRALVYPYYCGAYPRGWRLVGPFFNDNYFGAWLAALICLALVGEALRSKQPRDVLGLVLLLLAWSLTYSRAAVLALLAGLLVLAWRLSPRVLLLIPAVALIALPLAHSRDILRFVHPLQTQGGRIESVQRAARMLGERPLLGGGAGTGGLADMQFAKIVVELGLAGILAYSWLAWACLRPARGARGPDLRVGLAAAIVALAVSGVGGETLEVPQTGITLWALAGMLSRLGVPPLEAPGESEARAQRGNSLGG